MEITTTGFGVTCDVVIGALPRSASWSPMPIRERSVAPTYAPLTGEVRPQPAMDKPTMADLTDHPFVDGAVKGGARVRSWSPPD